MRTFLIFLVTVFAFSLQAEVRDRDVTFYLSFDKKVGGEIVADYARGNPKGTFMGRPSDPSSKSRPPGPVPAPAGRRMYFIYIGIRGRFQGLEANGQHSH